MIIKISDFKLAKSVIQLLCEQKDLKFVDLDLVFDKNNHPGVNIDKLYIGSPKNVGQTIYNIVYSYISLFNNIHNTELFKSKDLENEFLILLATYLRGVVYDNFNENKVVDDEFNKFRLYQNPFVWLVMKNIICPVYDKQIKNIAVITGPMAKVDVSCYVNKENEEFIFINSDINNPVVKNIFTLFSAIEAHELCPYKTLKSILESEVSDKFMGLVKLLFVNDNDLEMFNLTLNALLGIKKENIIKNAQGSSNFNPHPVMWWYLGVLEKMIEPARGFKWETYKSLEPYVDDFWNKVETYRKKKYKNSKMDGVPFAVLMKIKSQGLKSDTSKTIQALLSSDRVW